jgi:hypothetical protein
MNEGSFNWSLIPSFLAALEQGSLMGAARQTGISQPTLGRHIAELEQQLNVVIALNLVVLQSEIVVEGVTEIRTHLIAAVESVLVALEFLVVLVVLVLLLVALELPVALVALVALESLVALVVLVALESPVALVVSESILVP